MRASTFLATLLTAGAVTLAAAPSRASTTYPQVVADTLGMPCVPQCIICHATNVGGITTITRAFGIALKNTLNQTGGFQDDLLRMNLVKMRDMGINSDPDPMTDVQELAEGLDPNVPGGEVCTGPKYGCGATVAPRADQRANDRWSAASALLTVLAGLWLLRRR
ncbi:MAG TPA: hypothetical protein VJN18_16160 [Polyangiaceae bacterium]|nr:hypothetical protein [Polyangiaceae bacterium]